MPHFAMEQIIMDSSIITPQQLSEPAHDSATPVQHHVVQPPAAAPLPPSAPPPPAVPFLSAAPLKLKTPEEYSGKRDATTIDRWLFRVAYYCRCNGWDEFQWVMYAGSLLTGSASNWWQSYLTKLGFPNTAVNISWDSFAKAVRTKFTPALDADHAKDRLHECRQRTSASRYVQEFEEIRQTIRDEKLDFLHAFVYGLKPELRANVRIKQPETLEEAQLIAVEFDEAFYPRNSSKVQHRQFSGRHFTAPQPQSQVVPMELGLVNQRRSPHKSKHNSKPAVASNGRQITCFNCNELGHYRSDCPRLKRPASAPRSLHLISEDGSKNE